MVNIIFSVGGQSGDEALSGKELGQLGRIVNLFQRTDEIENQTGPIADDRHGQILELFGQSFIRYRILGCPAGLGDIYFPLASVGEGDHKPHSDVQIASSVRKVTLRRRATTSESMTRASVNWSLRTVPFSRATAA